MLSVPELSLKPSSTACPDGLTRTQVRLAQMISRGSLIGRRLLETHRSGLGPEGTPLGK